jgi:hypothetical protein
MQKINRGAHRFRIIWNREPTPKELINREWTPRMTDQPRMDANEREFIFHLRSETKHAVVSKDWPTSCQPRIDAKKD